MVSFVHRVGVRFVRRHFRFSFQNQCFGWGREIELSSSDHLPSKKKKGRVHLYRTMFPRVELMETHNHALVLLLYYSRGPSTVNRTYGTQKPTKYYIFFYFFITISAPLFTMVLLFFLQQYLVPYLLWSSGIRIICTTMSVKVRTAWIKR